MAERYFEGVGRRKTSTARVRLATGSGSFTVNDKPVQEYFPRTGDYESIVAPLRVSGFEKGLDVRVTVRGGGVSGQTDAVKHGLARALVEMNADLRPAMRKGGFLSRDDRIKERKKPGLKRARKAPTFTKR